MTPATFFDALWDDFTSIAPAAAAIRQHLVDAGEAVHNDHVAFRTFNQGPVRLDALEQPLLDMGFARDGAYTFEAKKLRAFGYRHADPAVPLVFLSELRTELCSPELQRVVSGLLEQVPADWLTGPEVFWSGRPWAPVAESTYKALQAESEYAAWLAALGFRANHFTVSINALSPQLRSVDAVLRFVEARGYRVNASGGRVKGSPQDLLEQGSTMADQVAVPFAEGERVVPTCYYEFALRHPQPDGSLYRGFVAASADRIFESTDARR